MSSWFEYHQTQRTQISTVVNAPYIQNSNQMASSVNRNRKFSKLIFSTAAIFKATSKLFGSQGCSDDKNWLDFSGILFKSCRFRSSILPSLQVFIPREALWVKFDSGVIFLDQSQFFLRESPGSPGLDLIHLSTYGASHIIKEFAHKCIILWWTYEFTVHYKPSVFSSFVDR